MAEIRPYQEADAAAAADLVGAVFPQPSFVTARTLHHWVTSAPRRAGTQAWVAYDGTDLIGWADSRLKWSTAAEDVAEVWAAVRHERRGQGLGTRLADLAEAHAIEIGGRTLTSFLREDEPEALAFAGRRGYAETRRERSWALDLRRNSCALPSPPDGFRLATLGELRVDEQALFELYDAAHSDMPSDHPLTLDFDEWRAETLENPELDLEASSLVLHEGRPVAFAWITSDRELRRGSHELTGTVPEYRGRGLARLAKEATIAWAAESGLDYLITSNDGTNAPMLAINERLGYEPRATLIEVTRGV